MKLLAGFNLHRRNCVFSPYPVSSVGGVFRDDCRSDRRRILQLRSDPCGNGESPAAAHTRCKHARVVKETDHTPDAVDIVRRWRLDDHDVAPARCQSPPLFEGVRSPSGRGRSPSPCRGGKSPAAAVTYNPGCPRSFTGRYGTFEIIGMADVKQDNRALVSSLGHYFRVRRGRASGMAAGGGLACRSV